VTALFREAGVVRTFVLLVERRDELRGTNRERGEQRLSPASTFKVANVLIGLSLGAATSVDEVIPYTGDANPFHAGVAGSDGAAWGNAGLNRAAVSGAGAPDRPGANAHGH
jgi:beta-lactamase class D